MVSSAVHLKTHKWTIFAKVITKIEVATFYAPQYTFEHSDNSATSI